MEFGFFRGLPEKLFVLDIVGQIAFLLDIVIQFFVAYRDPQTYRMIYRRPSIAFRYLPPLHYLAFFFSPCVFLLVVSLFQIMMLFYWPLNSSLSWITLCRYLKSTFVIDFLACMPWDLIYKVFLFLL